MIKIPSTWRIVWRFAITQVMSDWSRWNRTAFSLTINLVRLSTFSRSCRAESSASACLGVMGIALWAARRNILRSISIFESLYDQQ